MKSFKKKFQILPFLLISWNILDIIVHVATDFVEPLRIVGNLIGILAGVIVWSGIMKKRLHDPLLISAILVLILNIIQSYLYGYLIPVFIFIGASVFILLRLAQIDAVNKDKDASKAMLRHKWWIALLATLIGLLPVGLLGENLMQNRNVADLLISRQERIDSKMEELQNHDEISVTTIGVASPLGQTDTQTATAVFVNGQFLLFDAGIDSFSAMNEQNIAIEEIDAVFITHYHNDHYADLGDVMEWSWINGRRKILPVHGPSGITQIVNGFESAYELEATYRTAHHGEELMPSEWLDSKPVEFATPENNDSVIVYENDGVVVKAFRANHEPVEPAVGYRIEYMDKVVVISGDTLATTALANNSSDADILVAEVMNKDAIENIENGFREIGDERNATLMFDIRDYHMDIDDVANLAQDANVAKLVLNHLAPVPRNHLMSDRLYVDPVSEIYDGELFLGEEGMVVTISLEY